MTPTPACLILDLFGVLVAFDDALVADRIALHCADPASARQRLRDVPSDPDLIRGRLSLPGLHARLQREFGFAASFEVFQALWLESYSEAMPGMRSLLRDVSGRCRLVLLSNVDGVYWPVARSCIPELADFHATLLSFEQGVGKPEPEAFRRAVRAAQCPVEQCLFVDDKAENIQAAAALGLAGHLVKSTSALRLLLRALGVPQV